VDKNSDGTVTGTKTYYPVAGAMRVGSTLYYVLKDHLGSASVLTDVSGKPVSGADTRYYPFGEARSSTTPMLTDKLFTGQREMAGLGIYNYGARFYSPKLGRFLSADTIVHGYTNPQNLNRFSYVTNNPLRYTDPTGHMLDEGCSTGCGYTSLPTNNYCTTHPWACGGNGGCGGGGHPLPMPNPNPDDNIECPDWNVCATDVSSDIVHDYWTTNKNYLNTYNQWTTTTAIGAFVSAVATYTVSAISGGQPIFTPQFIALVTGIAVVEPTQISKFLLGTAIVLAASSVALQAVANNLQNINNAIVENGALNTGGTITASPTQVTIITSKGTTTVPSILVGQITLNSWAGGNPNLVTPP
jgi:RHS repeat-associated protein